MNQVKQFMLAMHNHVSARNVFPGGGSKPHARIEDYLTAPAPGGTPLGPKDQGLTWAFQILPYLEQNAIHNLRTTDQLRLTTVPMFNCPSRRGPTRYAADGANGAYLMDYAAAVPYRVRSSLANPANFDNGLQVVAGGDTTFCGQNTFWGGRDVPRKDGDPNTVAAIGSGYQGFLGVIVRADLWVSDDGTRTKTGFYEPITFAKITDGSSNTLVLGEKWLQPSEYEVGDNFYDDRGWSDGWDPDTLRSTICTFHHDSELVTGTQYEKDATGYSFGSAHASGMNAGFADASVRFISYDIGLELFNQLAHRSDEEAPAGTIP
jgi:hypothetical protein